jgi:gamma-glutamylcysteine synthetase
MLYEICPFDPNSFANAHQVKTIHSHLEWCVLMEEKKVQGSVSHTFEVLNEISEIVLDTKDLKVTKVTFVKGQLPVLYH